jgi:hypothetical protein
MENKSMLIDVIPKIIGHSKEEIDILVKNFREWIAQDHGIIIPLIGALSEIPLSDAQKKRVNKTIIDSLHSIDELDIPVVIRTLLKTINKACGEEIVRSIQEQCKTISDDSYVLIIEILTTTFSVNSMASEFFIKILKQTEEYSSFDVVLIFLLLQKNSKEGLSVFHKALLQGALTKSLVYTIQKKGLQQYIAPSVYTACIYLLKNDVFMKNTLVTQYFQAVFEFYDSIRLNLITSIISALTIGSIGGSILTSLSKDSKCSDLLSRYGSIIEDFLHNTQTLSDENIKCLAVSICNCSKSNLSILQTLAIFIRKTLFSGQSFDNKIGVVTASYSINTSAFSSDDIDRFFEWIFQLFKFVRFEH